MANEVMDKEVSFEVNGENVRLTPNMIQQFLTSGNGKITPQETMMFLNLCKYQHLNPFLKEAYIIKFGDSPAQIITSKEAFMKRAESSPNYDGVSAGCIVLRNNEIVYTKGAFILPTDNLVGAWADVKRKDRSQPHHVEIGLKEFSKGQSTWNAMPATMIRKTAIVNALREAFPESLGAMYTEDDKNPNETSTKAAQNQTEPSKTQNKLADIIGGGNDATNNAGELETEPEPEIIESIKQDDAEEIEGTFEQPELL